MYKFIQNKQYSNFLILNIFSERFKSNPLYGKFIRNFFFKKIYSFLFCFILFMNVTLAEAVDMDKINPDIRIETKMAYKYCQSIEKRLFAGLDNELILKYEYFFSSIPKDSINDINKFMENFSFQVDSICSYKLNETNIKEFNIFLERFYFEGIN